MELIKTYFPELNETQLAQYEALYDLYTDWNSKINVISRKDIENLYPHHVLHSLGLTKMMKFKDGSSVMDIGTGGGFPGIPLAIFFPEVQFHLVDSIGKKDQGRTSRGGSYRFEERNIPSLPGRRGKTAFRFCCQPGSHAIGRPGQNIPQKCKERTAERIAQRIDMSERR